MTINEFHAGDIVSANSQTGLSKRRAVVCRNFAKRTWGI